MNSTPLRKFHTPKNIKLCVLNDDCLISILRYLSLKDLNSVGLSCHRTHDVVLSESYRHHSKLKSIDITRLIQRLSDVGNLKHRINYLNGYLQRFGHLIEHIHLDNNRINLSLEFIKSISLFIRMFSTERFVSLKINNLNFDNEFIVNMRNVFKHLTKLEINGFLQIFSQRVQI